MAVYRVMNYEPEGEDVCIGKVEVLGPRLVEVWVCGRYSPCRSLNDAATLLREVWGWPGAYLVGQSE